MKLQGEACNFIKRLRYRFFLLNHAKFLRTILLQNTFGRLLPVRSSILQTKTKLQSLRNNPKYRKKTTQNRVQKSYHIKLKYILADQLFYFSFKFIVCLPIITYKSANFIKKVTPTQVFYCEYCEIFKSSFLIEHFQWLLLNHSLMFVM